MTSTYVHSKEREKLKKRMDRLDTLVYEYLRTHKSTLGELSVKLDCAPSTIWRYCRKVDCFRKMPLETLAEIFRLANVSNDDVRFVLGLPRGVCDE